MWRLLQNVSVERLDRIGFLTHTSHTRQVLTIIDMDNRDFLNLWNLLLIFFFCFFFEILPTISTMNWTLERSQHGNDLPYTFNKVFTFTNKLQKNLNVFFSKQEMRELKAHFVITQKSFFLID